MEGVSDDGFVEFAYLENMIEEMGGGIRWVREGRKVVEGDGRGGGGDVFDVVCGGFCFVMCRSKEDDDGECRVVGENEFAELHH